MQSSPGQEVNSRQQIIDTTSRLLETQGYHGTGLNQIIRESGAPRGSLYYYFPAGKEELTAEAVAQSARGLGANMRTQLAAIPDPVAAIHTFLVNLAGYVEAGACQVGAPFAAVALETAAASDRLAASCQDAYDGLQQVVADKLTTGGWPPDQAASLAVAVIATIEGSIILARARRTAAPVLECATHVRRLLECARPT